MDANTARPSSPLCRLADTLLPAAAAAGDPRLRRRGRLLALLAPAAALLLLGAAALAARRGATPGVTWVFVAASASSLALAIALWRTGSIAPAGHVFTAVMLAVAVATVAATAGSEESGFVATCLLATIPLLGVTLAGPGGGTVWGLLAALAAVGLTDAAEAGSTGAAEAPALAILVVLGVALAYSRLEEAAFAECERERERAELARQAKGELIAHLSHEIRSPLDVAIGMTDMLLETELNGEQSGLARTARSACERTLALVNDILDLARLEAGRMPVETRRFDLRGLLAEATRPHALVARRKGIELSLGIDDRVPAEVVGDPGRLHQVVTNLLSNAVKFTERGSAAVTAKPLEAAPGWIRIDVRDTGVGIAEDDLPRLFEPFVQSGRPRGRELAGSGLGLAISRELVALMGGRLRVESRPGEGSRFSLELPLAEVRGGEAGPRGAAPSRAA